MASFDQARYIIGTLAPALEGIVVRDPEPSVLRFGVFELETKSGELRRAGIQVKLPPQPLTVLAYLAGRAGKIVSREELCRAVELSELKRCGFGTWLSSR